MRGSFKRFSRCLLLLAILFSSVSTEGASSEELTWDACMRLTAEHNPQLFAARANVEAAEAGVRTARAALFPQLSLGANAEYQDRESEELSGTSGESEFDVALSLQQTLYSGGMNSAQISKAKAALNEAEADFSSVNAEIMQALRTAFVELLYDQQHLDLLKGIKDRREENLELVSLRYEGGLEHLGAVELNRAALYEAEADVRAAERKVKSDQQVLLNTIGMEKKPDGIVVTGGFEPSSVPEKTADWNIIVQKTPDYRKTEAQKSAARAQLKEARSGFLPALDLVGSAGRYGDEDAFNTDRWTVGLQLSFPFWPGGKNVQEYEQAKAQWKQAVANASGTRNNLTRDLNEVMVDFQNAMETITVRETYVKASQLRAEVARQQYTTGLLTFDNWDIIENDLIENEKRLLESKRSAMLAEASWWYKTGIGVIQ